MFAKLEEIKPGDKLVADGGFTCMREGTVHQVEKVEFGNRTGLAIICHEGKHFLDGQTDEKGHLVGLTKIDH